METDRHQTDIIQTTNTQLTGNKQTRDRQKTDRRQADKREADKREVEIDRQHRWRIRLASGSKQAARATPTARSACFAPQMQIRTSHSRDLS